MRRLPRIERSFADGDSRELENARNMFGKAAQRMVAAVANHGPRARVFERRLAPVEHLVAGLEQQQVALRVNRVDNERTPAFEVRARKLVGFAGIEISLRAKQRLEADV